MDYIEAASILGQALLESEQFVEQKASENALLADEKAQALLLEYRELQNKMVEQAKDNVSKEDLETIRKTLLDKQMELNEYPITKRYFDGKKAFEQMMQEVNSVLEHYLTGGESSCSGSCETCGGCE